MKIMEDAETIWKKALSSGLLAVKWKYVKQLEKMSLIHIFKQVEKRQFHWFCWYTSLLYPAKRFLPKKKKRAGGGDGFNKQM